MSIKLIASDMDGTLLNSKKELPPDFEGFLKKLHDKGIIFAAASGRQYNSLMHEFKDIGEEILYIAENGAMVIDGGKTIVCETMKTEDVIDILKVLRNVPEVLPTACGVKHAYGERANNDIYMYYKNYVLVDDIIEAVKQDDILKLAIYDRRGPENNSYKYLKNYNDRYNILISGTDWVDVMNKNVTKGSAIRKVRQHYGIKKEECMAFGDFLNDYDMMLECGETYAMENAHPDLKKICKYVAKSCDENGVVDAVKKALGI